MDFFVWILKLLLALLVLPHKNVSNKIQTCHVNPCQNGGECYRVGASIESTYCDDGWTSYNGVCYILLKSEQSWVDAFRHCRSNQANMLSIENEATRKFVTEFAKSELKVKAQFASGKVLSDLWTSGRLNTEHGADWMWVREEGNETIQTDNQYWKPYYQIDNHIPDTPANLSNLWLSGRYFAGVDKNNSAFNWLDGYDKRPILGNFFNRSESMQTNVLTNDACISVTSSSSYSDWVVEDCESKRNYFICQKEEPLLVDAAGYYNYQCRCKPNFGGFNCEIAAQVSFTPIQQQVCDSEPFQFSCSKNGDGRKENIIVEYAAYGSYKTGDNKRCHTSLVDDCIADNSLFLIAKHCHGQPSCSVPSPKKLFTMNPCLPGTTEELACPSDTIQHQKNCYEIVYKEDRSVRKSWEDAKKYCQSKGGDLAGPIDSEAHELLTHELAKKDERKVKYFWIGLKMDTDYKSQPTSGNWANGAKMDYTPEGARLDEGECVAYYVQPPSRVVWLAKTCTYFYNWICQYSLSGPERPRLLEPSVVKMEVDAAQTAPNYVTFVPKVPSEFSIETDSITMIDTAGPTVEHITDLVTPVEILTSVEAATSSVLGTSVDQHPAVDYETTLGSQTGHETSVEQVTSGETVETMVKTETTFIPSTLPPKTSRTQRPRTTTMPTEETTTRRRRITTTTEEPLTTRRQNRRTTTQQTVQDTTRRPSRRTTTFEPTSRRWTTISRYYPTSHITRPTTTIVDETVEATTLNVHHFINESHVNVILSTFEVSMNSTQNPFGSSNTSNSTLLDHLKSYESKFAQPQVPVRLNISRSSANLTFIETTSEISGTVQHEQNTEAPRTTLTETIPNVFGNMNEICYNTTVRNVRWPNTLANNVAKVLCPHSDHRYAYWHCRKQGATWNFYPDNPNLSDCRHDEALDQFRDQIISNKSAFAVAISMFDFWLAEKSSVYGGDIYASLYLMNDLVKLQRQQLQQSTAGSLEKQTIASGFTQKLGDIVDVLMSKDVLPIWNDLPLIYKYGNVTVLLHTLDDNADLLAHYLDTTDEKNFTFNSMTLNVQVHRPFGNQPVDDRASPPIASGILPVSSIHEGFVDSTYRKTSVSDAPVTLTLNTAQSQIKIPFRSIVGSVAVSKTIESQKYVPQTGAAFGVAHVASNINDVSVDQVAHELDVTVGMFQYANGLPLLLAPPTDEATSKRVIVNSQIVGASINNRREMLLLSDDQVTNVTLTHLHLANVKNPRCVYWNTSLNVWDDYGCSIQETNEKYTVCACNHLTSFAILMDVTGALDAISPINSQILTYVTLVGCIISIVCLVLCVVVFSVFRTLWNERNTIHRNLCICLLIGELLYVCGIDHVQDKGVCVAVAVLLQYFFLAAFCWMLIEGYQLYRMLIKVFESEKSFLIFYYIICYGFPALITAISVGVRFPDYGTVQYCWINVHSTTIWSFVAPVALVIFINIIFLAMALKVVFTVSTLHDKSKFEKMKGWLRGSTMLLCLLGVTWIFGFCVTIQPAAVYFAYIFAIFNSLQGVFIFAFHVVLNEKCHSAIVRSFGKCLPDWMPRKPDSIGSNSTASSNLKKLSDTLRHNTLSAKRGDVNNTFSMNQTVRPYSNPYDQHPAELYLKRVEENCQSSLSESEPHSNERLLYKTNSNVDPTTFRQRFAKNKQQTRRDSFNSSDALTASADVGINGRISRLNSSFVEDVSDAPHVLTISTDSNEYNNNGHPRKQQQFVGHF